MEKEEGLDDSASSTAYEGDISRAESQGSLEFSELAVSGAESETDPNATPPSLPHVPPALKSKPRDSSDLLISTANRWS